jgi:hypothetical protein
MADCGRMGQKNSEAEGFAEHATRAVRWRVRSCGINESRTVPCGRGGSMRSIRAVGNERSRELCEVLELAPTTLQAASLPALHQPPQ